MSGRRLPRYIATTLVCALLAVVIYRAKTQSLTIDEAFTFNLFVDESLDQFLLVYDACNHILHTLLTKFVRYWLGTSELVLRLVSLIGALLYFIVVRRLCRMAAGSGWTHVIGIAALGFNPLVLDFLVAARGYGLALALLLWSIYYSVRWLNEGREVALLWRAGLAAGLSIAANLTLLVPVAALGATLLLRSRRWSVIDLFGGPAIVVGFLFVALPLARSNPEHFYFGAGTMRETVASLWEPSFGYLYTRDTELTAVFVAIATFALGMLVRRMRNDSPDDLTADIFVLSTVTLALSLAALFAMHWFLSVPFPFRRSGLYLIPLFVLSLLAASALLMRRHWWARRFRLSLGYAGAGLLAIAAVIFAAKLNTRYFVDWRFDASTNRLIDVIIKDNKIRGGRPFSIASTRLYAETLKYYRKRRRLHRMSPEVPTLDLEKADVEYFVLAEADEALVGKLGLRIITRDDLSGTVVAGKS